MQWENTNGVAGAGRTPDSKVNRATMGPIWGRQDPDGPHGGHMNLAFWDYFRILMGSGKAPGVKRTICSLYKFNLG